MENKEAVVRVFDTRGNVEGMKRDIKSAIVIHDNGKGDFLLSKHNRETHIETTGMYIDGNIDVTEKVTRVYNKGLYKISKREANLLRKLSAESLMFKTVLTKVLLSPDLTKLNASRESQEAIREIMNKGNSLATDAIDSKVEEEQKAKEKQAKEKQEQESKYIESVLNKFRGSGKE
ncbi:MAG: hypothetical protein IJ019_00715 [Alphaproteobacteria bacterium]|nr:hypothetical protein [Alphaproteobacteria bacterium]